MARRDKYDIHKIRSQVKAKVGKHNDPTEFKPPKAEDGKPSTKFRFFILPPFEEGDVLSTGNAEQNMEEFFLRNGSHYLDNKRLGCPRVIEDGQCGICQHGFDLMKETDDKEQRREIAKKLLPGTYMMVNIYFPDIAPNPVELRGQVRWYNCPKTVFDLWEDCLYRDDDGGDPQEPLAHGVFYDEEDAFLFQLEVYKHGQGNNYGKSKFFLTESMRSLPLSGKPGKPNDAKVAEILAMRYNLFDKLPDVSAAEIDRVARNLTGDGGGDGGGFDADETKSGTKGVKEKAQKAKKSGLKPAVAESSAAPKPKAEPDEPATEPVSGEIPVDDPPFETETAAETEVDGDDEDVDALLSQLGDD